MHQRSFLENGLTSSVQESSPNQLSSGTRIFSPESKHNQVHQEFTLPNSSPRVSKYSSPTQSYPMSGHGSFTHEEFIDPNPSTLVKSEGERLGNEDALGHISPEIQSVSQNVSLSSQDFRRKSQTQQGIMHASASRRSSQRVRGTSLSQQANAYDELEGLQTQEVMYSPSFRRESIGKPRLIFNGLDMPSQSSGEQTLQHHVAYENDYGKFEDEQLDDQQTPEMQQSLMQEYGGMDRQEAELFMGQGSFPNDNNDLHHKQYDDREWTHDAFEEDIDTSEMDEMHEGLPDESYALVRKSRGKSMVQEFIYPSSRGSFKKDGLSTDQEAKQVFYADANDAPSSLRIFSRLSVSDSSKDLTKQQTQELMYSPSFAKESTKQHFEMETNMQNIQQRPEGKEIGSQRRQSYQRSLEDQEYKEQVYSSVGGQLEVHEQHDLKLPSLVGSNVLDSNEVTQDFGPACDGGLSNKEANYASVSRLNMEEHLTNEDSVHSPLSSSGLFETTSERELDDGYVQFEQESNYLSLSKVNHEEKHEGLEYLLSAESNGNRKYLDDSLLEKKDVSSQDFEGNGKPNRDNERSHQSVSISQSKSFINLENSKGSFKRGFSSSRSFIKFPLGASQLSYEGFAMAHFVEPTVGVWPFFWKSVLMQDLIKFSKDPLTQPLLQRLTVTPHRQLAVSAFTHLLAYLGDVLTKRDHTYHIQQILMLGIKYSDLRDEIFCQICKQTTANPSRQSNGRGWQAMALCVGTFTPSSTFRPFLEAHLEQVSKRFVGECAGAALSYQDEGMSNPSKAAEYCLARFHKLAQTGARHIAPLLVEINAVELDISLENEITKGRIALEAFQNGKSILPHLNDIMMETVRVNIYMPDDTFKVLNLDPMTTAGEVTEQLAKMNGLSDPSYYGIFQVLYADTTVEKVLSKNSYIMEIISDWKKASLPPLEGDSRFIMKAKRIFEKHVLCLPNIELRGDYYSNNGFPEEIPKRREMLFKRKIFIEDLSALSEDVQKSAENFGYVQTIRDVEYGVYPVEEHDAVMLGALQLRADSRFFGNLDDALTEEIIRKFGPKIYVEGREREWKAALLRTAAALPHEADISTCIGDYIDFLRSRCALYGCCWYYVEQKADPRLPHEMFVAINTAGVYFVEVKTKELLLHMQFTEICSWGYSTYLFSLVTGNMTYNHDHRLITMQGAEIGETLQMYINHLHY